MKKTIALLLTIIIFSAAFVGCGGNGEENKELNVVYCHHGSDTIDYVEETYRYAIDVFKKNFPDVKVNIRVETLTKDNPIESITKRIQTQLMTDSVIDILFINHLNDIDFNKAIQANAFYDMGDYLKENVNFDEYVNKLEVEDSHYIVPTEIYTNGLLTTNDILSRYDINDFENTSDNLFELINTRENILDGENLYQESLNELIFVEDCIDCNENTVDIYKLKEAFKAYKKIYKNTPPSMEYFKNKEKYNKEGVFVYKHYNMMLNTETYEKNGGELMFLLKDINGRTTAQLKNGVVIPTNSNNKRNACEFIKIFLSEEQQKKSMLGVPVHKKAIEDIMLEQARGSGDDKLYQKLYNYNTNIYNIRIGVPKIENIIYTELTPYFNDEKSLDECLQSTQDKLEIYISE